MSVKCSIYYDGYIHIYHICGFNHDFGVEIGEEFSSLSEEGLRNISKAITKYLDKLAEEDAQSKNDPLSSDNRSK